MTPKDKLLSMVAMAKKAGLLTAGFDPVKEGIQAGKVKAVFVTADCSPKTKKEAVFFAEKGEVSCTELPIDMNEIEKMIRRKAGVIGVADEGIGRRIQTLASETAEEECR